MTGLIALVHTILALPTHQRTRTEIVKLKRAWAKENKQSNVPTNIQVLKTYYALITKEPTKKVDRIEQLLKKRAIRSQSGIVAVQVLTKPFRCPGKCIFCPNDATMPKSYINTQPGAMRALLNNFDPYKQVYNRLLSLSLTGHNTDKIEMIVLGGTRDVYPKSYKVEFIKGLYDACNTFPDFLEKIDIDFTSQKAARYTVTEDLDITYPESIQESITINETAQKRIIGLTIETRPEYVTDENCQLRRDLGVTRMEMGIQTLHNDVHEANVRGHDNQAIREAMHRLRQYGFKVSNHYMPGLYTSTPEKDLETFQIAFTTPWIKSDELKFYPTAVIPNTPLYDLYKSGDYTPIQEDDLAHIIKEFKTNIIPPYSRIKRLARDFDTNEVVAGANTPNLRQLLMNDMQKAYNTDPQARKKQYTRLYGDEESYTHVDDQDGLLSAIKTPMGDIFVPHISLSSEERKIDGRMETFSVGGCFEIDEQRNFSCLCTRCREMRHIHDQSPKDKKQEVTGEKNQNQARRDVLVTHPDETKESGDISPDDGNRDMPFLVVRRYRSSNGEEMFLSIEDRLGYLYGFARLLLPDAGGAVDYVGVEEGKALVREVHVYGSLASLEQTLRPSGTSLVREDHKTVSQGGDVGSAQHKGFGTQLMEAAEVISKSRGYDAVSVISGIGVRKYYEKLGYALQGTYMVKEV